MGAPATVLDPVPADLGPGGPGSPKAVATAKTFRDALRNVDATDAVVKDAEAYLDEARAAHENTFKVVADALKKHVVVVLSDGKAIVADPTSTTGYKAVDPATEDTVLD